MNQDDPDHWAFHMRRCPFVGCRGVVDDDLAPPRCCACGNELRDGPGCMALPSPSGRRFQHDPCPGFPEGKLPPLPEGVVSLETCLFCGGHEVATDMGPHRFVMEMGGTKHVEQLTYPAMECLACEQGWTDHRGETVRTEAMLRIQREHVG